MAGKIWKGLFAVGALLLSATQAEARRTIIEQGSNTPTELSGYCDFNGDDCNPIALNYGIDFGDGQGFLDDAILYGNGVISFGESRVFFTSSGGKLNIDGGPSITPGINNETTFVDAPGGGYLQGGMLFTNPDGRIVGSWYNCGFTTSSCGPVYQLTLTPLHDVMINGALFTGFQVRNEYIDRSMPANSGAGVDIPNYPDTSMPDVVKPGVPLMFADTPSFPTIYYLPVLFDERVPPNPPIASIPEPSTWAMIMIGLALIGYALRRSRSGQRTFVTPRAITA